MSRSMNRFFMTLHSTRETPFPVTVPQLLPKISSHNAYPNLKQNAVLTSTTSEPKNISLQSVISLDRNALPAVHTHKLKSPY